MNMMKAILCSAQWNGQLLMNKKTQLDTNLKVSCMWMYAQIYKYFFPSLYMFCSPLGPNTEENAWRRFVNTHPLVVNMTDIILTRCVSMLWIIRWNLRKMKCGCQSFIFQDHGDLLRDLFPIIDKSHICWASNLLDQNILPPQISWSTLPKTIA